MNTRRASADAQTHARRVLRSKAARLVACLQPLDPEYYVRYDPGHLTSPEALLLQSVPGVRVAPANPAPSLEKI